MANKSNYWRLSLTIDVTFERLVDAAFAAHAFLETAPTEQVVILRRLCSNHIMVVDRDTFLANRSTLKHQATCIIFMGNLADLASLAQAVPPTLFNASAPAPRPPLEAGNKEH
jgi:hypothetical protein